MTGKYVLLNPPPGKHVLIGPELLAPEGPQGEVWTSVAVPVFQLLTEECLHIVQGSAPDDLPGIGEEATRFASTIPALNAVTERTSFAVHCLSGVPWLGMQRRYSNEKNQ